MLTEDCKSYLYSNSVGQFKNYVDEIYNTKKIYNIQNYSNTDDAYIYNIRILDECQLVQQVVMSHIKKK